MHASGEFQVKLVPQAEEREIELFGRMTIDKVLQGDLSGTSQGQMLSFRTAVADSAGYVAVEKVEGLLHGKRGSFVLQHHALMNRGKPTIDIIVLPDSGTGELKGLTGTFTIIQKDKKHFYEMEYELPVDGHA